MKSNFTLRPIVRVGMLSALVFATAGLRIRIPIDLGGTVAIHLGNVLCLLSGLLLGPVSGGLAAGIGSCLFDLFDPIYVTSAPFTLVGKFLMGFLAGKLAYAGGRDGMDHRRNLFGCVTGSVTYTVFYTVKSFLSNLIVKNLAPGPAWVLAVPNLLTSIVNAVLAVLIAVPLAAAIRSALRRSGLDWR